MRYFLITILPLLFFSSFKTVQLEGVSDSQFVRSDSCRLSKIYRDGEIHAVYHYDSMKNIVRSETYGNFPRNRIGKTTAYSEYKHDNLGRITKILNYEFMNLIDGRKGFFLRNKEVFIYPENSNLVSETRYYNVNLTETKKPPLARVKEYIYNSTGQLVKIQPIELKKKRRKIIRKILPYWFEYKYDNRNNPVIIEKYEIRKEQQTFVRKTEKEYDSFPNVLPSFNFPSSTNNIIRKKVSSLYNNNNEWKVFKNEYDYQYDDRGLITNQQTSKEIFEYEYICD